MTNIPIIMPAGTVRLEVERSGSGRPLLLLHGGAGPESMWPLLKHLDGFELLLPTHPGFDKTEQPPWFASVADLADCYIGLLEGLGLQDVVVVGNSVGGWIAAEMAARRPEAVTGIILIDAVGLAPTESTGPIINPRFVPIGELVKLSFADPARARVPTPEVAAQMGANQRVLATYAGDPFMHDPLLPERLSAITVPSLVLWGRQDGIVTQEYGQDYARQIPGARFQLIEDAGHFPQIEQPEPTARAIRDYFARGNPR